jgi:hypothetical protein
MEASSSRRGSMPTRLVGAAQAGAAVESTSVAVTQRGVAGGRAVIV